MDMTKNLPVIAMFLLLSTGVSQAQAAEQAPSALFQMTEVTTPKLIANNGDESCGSKMNKKCGSKSEKSCGGKEGSSCSGKTKKTHHGCAGRYFHKRHKDNQPKVDINTGSLIQNN